MTLKLSRLLRYSPIPRHELPAEIAPSVDDRTYVIVLYRLGGGRFEYSAHGRRAAFELADKLMATEGATAVHVELAWKFRPSKKAS
jgi:hypothetical protein